MHCLRSVSLILLSTSLLALTGCGGGSGSGTFNPVPAAGSSLTTPPPPSFSNTSSVAGKYTISLQVDRAAIDANLGQLLAAATIANSSGAAIAGCPVTFSVAAGPATVVPSLATVSTDSSGTALTVITPGDVLTTTNVILMATASINGDAIRAYAPFQIVRGSGVIKFSTTKAPTDPDGTLFTLDQTVAANFAGVPFEFMQQLPFQVTDANGNPRVGVPVTLSVENQLTGLASIAPGNPTVITDSAGKGIFNVGVTMTAPPPGITHTDAIIYRALSTEASGTPQLLGYAGFVVVMSTKNMPLVISPSTASFGTGFDLTYTISGGVEPYAVISSNDAFVSATPGADGVTVTAHLQLSDPALLTAPVTITVRDAAGNSATATVAK